VPVGADHVPFEVSHTAKGAPVVAPEQVAVQRVWLVQPPAGQEALSGVVTGTPLHGIVAAGSSGATQEVSQLKRIPLYSRAVLHALLCRCCGVLGDA
jgi:hypothetical protein